MMGWATQVKCNVQSERGVVGQWALIGQLFCKAFVDVKIAVLRQSGRGKLL
jgi:hypothetical protein